MTCRCGHDTLRHHEPVSKGGEGCRDCSCDEFRFPPSANDVEQAIRDLYNAVGHRMDGSPIWDVLDYAFEIAGDHRNEHVGPGDGTEEG